MSIERALYSYLTGHPAVSAVLGTRVYPEAAPTERSAEFPYVTYTQSGRQLVYHMGGFSGLARASLTLDIWAETQPQREAVAAALHTALHAWAPESREAVAIRRATVEEQPDSFATPTDGSERGVYQRALEVDIWYKQL